MGKIFFAPQKIASSYTKNISVFFGDSECINRAILSKELSFAQINIKGCFHTNWNMSHVSTLQKWQRITLRQWKVYYDENLRKSPNEMFSVVHSGIKNTPHMLHFLRSSDIGKFFFPFRLPQVVLIACDAILMISNLWHFWWCQIMRVLCYQARNQEEKPTWKNVLDIVETV